MRKELSTLILMAGIICPIAAQICDGNFGENIFTEGDFGSGAQNVLLPNPQIAPGYTYEPNPPPNDGFYTITNNTSAWGSFASNWANIKDNSTDPNGYMMVVNASFSPGLFYKKEVQGLCENTLYVFSVDVFNLLTNTSGGAIKPNVSFLLDGVVVYGTGDIPANQQWNTYGFTFTTDPGQTSLTLALQNNAPGGGGNDLALDNITFRPCGPEALILPTDIANICEDGSPIDLEATIVGTQYDTPNLQWQQSFDEGMTWVDIAGATGMAYAHTDLSGGTYYYRYLLANDPSNLLNSKCRVVSNIKIVHVVPKFYTIIDTLCQGLSFYLGNNIYSTTGIYVDSLLTSIGCDSIVTLDLTVLPDSGMDAIFNLNDPSCPYLLDGSIQIDTILNGTEPFNIYINDELAAYPASLFNLGEGSFAFQIIDHIGCRFDTVINLQTPDPFIIELGDDWQIDLGETVQLSPFFSGPAETYIWTPTDLIDCNMDCASVNFTPTNSALFNLTAISENGCEASDSIYVQVNTIRKVYIPNSFSPNSDGFNDFFNIYAAVPNVRAIEQFMVFDRWGGVVFEGKNLLPNEPNIGWDGNKKGKAMPSGIYGYFAKIKFLDGAVVLYEGDVILVR